MARFHGRKGRPWRRVQARVYREETHCHRCGRYVDQTLANYRASAARSVDHLIPPDIAPELANDRGNLRLAHYGCNSSAWRGEYAGVPVNRGQGNGALPSRARARGAWTQRRGVVGRGATGRVAMARVVTKRDRDW